MVAPVAMIIMMEMAQANTAPLIASRRVMR
jgi:hypothetical protein